MTLALALVLLELLMPQPFGPLVYCSHEIVLGVQQSGKTTLVRERLASARRVVFATPHPGDYADDGELVTVDELRRQPELLDGVVCRLVVPLGDEERDDDEADEVEARDVLQLVRFVRREAPARGPLVLVLDEVGDYRRRCEATLGRLHRNGHHRGVASVLISQCATDIPPTCHRNATRVVSLLQTRTEDLDALEAQYGATFRERAARWQRGDPPALWMLSTLDPSRKE